MAQARKVGEALTRRPEGRPTLRDRILVAAGNLFHEQGIRGVGVEAIAEAAGTNKMTLYRYFPSKDELITEWVRGMLDHKEEQWAAVAARYKGDPKAQLVAWSEGVASRLATMEERGSSIFNALAELPERDHPARKLIHEFRSREQKRVLKLCREAGFEDPELAADTFAMLLDGAHSCVQCTGMKRVGEHLVKLVNRLVANSRRRSGV